VFDGNASNQTVFKFCWFEFDAMLYRVGSSGTFRGRIKMQLMADTWKREGLFGDGGVIHCCCRSAQTQGIYCMKVGVESTMSPSAQEA
jgi:hypothetical protein